MANRDYVKRGRGTNNKKAPARKKQPSRGKPWRSGLLAIVLVSGFGYGLYTLSNDPEPPEPTVTQTATKVSKPKSSEKVLPPPPEERWDYVDSLPKREIEVEAKELQVSKIPYVMQCGAYKQQGQAEERKVNIAFQGLNSKVVKRPNSSWYRVVLGPYTTKREAVRDQHKLQRAKIEPCMIFRESEY